MKSLTESDLLDALKISARAYLFSARYYDEIDTLDFMIEKWEDLTGYYNDLGYDIPPDDDEFLDDEVDPSRFLRVFSELVRRSMAGQIENPDLHKAVSSVKLVAEFEVAAADEKMRDLTAIMARRILKALDQPVPGKLRTFFGSWGLAPR
ncbi:MAG: hypothetical protein ACXW30_00030 [Micavibrio sp.]